MRGSAIITSKYDLTHTEPLEQSDQELQQFTAKEAEHFIYANEKKIDSATTNGNGRHCVFRSLFFLFLNSYLMFVHCQDVANPPCYYLLLYIYRDVKEK